MRKSCAQLFLILLRLLPVALITLPPPSFSELNRSASCASCASSANRITTQLPDPHRKTKSATGDDRPAEWRVQMPKLRAPSVLRLALCTFLRKKLSSLVVSTVVPKRHLRWCRSACLLESDGARDDDRGGERATRAPLHFVVLLYTLRLWVGSWKGRGGARAEEEGKGSTSCRAG